MGRFAAVFDSVVGSTIRPGAPGTAKSLRDWGDRLVAVRYRYSDDPPTRFTTIELVVAAAPWKISPTRQVFVEVRSWEWDLREKVKAAGGRWVPKAARWRMRYDRAVGLGLKERASFLARHARHAPHAPTPRKSLQIQESRNDYRCKDPVVFGGNVPGYGNVSCRLILVRRPRRRRLCL